MITVMGMGSWHNPEGKVETQTPQYKAAFRIWCKTQIISVQG
jgi:hypothetical protein